MIPSIAADSTAALRSIQPQVPTRPDESAAPNELREAFDQFVGETFYGQMLKSMRQSVGKPAYFHGGQGEEIFRNQMDQVLVERMTDATASTFTGPMFDLFSLKRS